MSTLTIDVGSDVSDALAGLGEVGQGTSDLTADLADLGRESADASRKVGLSADAADELAGKAGKTTGALGALSSGFELVGLEGFAGGLQSAAMATDFMSGAGDALNLVMESTAVKAIGAKVAMVGSSIATGAAAVATGVMTAAQWALNAAMSANPIALVVLAIVALVAGFVLLYKKSDTFRGLIKDIGNVGKKAINGIVTVTSSLVGWVKDKIPGAFNTAQTLVVGYIRLITLPWRTLFTIAKNIFTWVSDKIPTAFESAKTAAGTIGSALVAPFQALFDLLEKILNKIGDIVNKAKDIGSGALGFVTGGLLGRASASLASANLLSSSSSRAGTTYVDNRQFHVSGVLDVVGAARQLRNLEDRAGRIYGAVTP